MAPTVSFTTKFKSLVSTPEKLSVASPRFQAQFVRLILSKETNAAPTQQIERFFGPYRIPGTSSIGLRKRCPEIFQDTDNDTIEPYDQWLMRILNQTIERMQKVCPGLSGQNPAAGFQSELLEKIRIILDFKDDEQTPLCELIPQQMYEDVFIRMITMIIEEKTEPKEPYLYKNFNNICHRLAVSLILCMKDLGMLCPTDSYVRQLIHIAVLSGYVGINLKSSASAASTLLNRELIPIKKHWIKNMESVAGVSDQELDAVSRMMISLSSASGACFGIDSTPVYFNEVVDAAEPTLLVFFSDDYMESIIDLKRFEIMMGRNQQLYVLFVPRNGRYGNDLAWEDMQGILNEPVFRELSLLQQQDRFFVSHHGPMAGCIDIRYISAALIEQIESLSQDKTLIFETKGCRNFEMLRGRLSFPWYTSFNCNRALSIRTVGIDMEPVFLRIPPGLKAYDGFMNPKTGTTPSGKTMGVKFARMTTLDLYDALETNAYIELLKQSENERALNQSLMKKCSRDKMTVPELLGAK